MIAETFINPVEHEVIDPIAKRWSPRAYSSQRVEREKLLAVLEAARWSASSYNEQPWRFIVATKDKPAAFQNMLGVANEWNQKWAGLAPALILTTAKKTFSHNGKPNNHAWHDIGQTVATLTLEAAQHDLYIHQMAGIDANKARELFNVPDDYDVVTLLTLGYLGDIKNLPQEFHKSEGRKRERKPLNELVFENEFGQPSSLVK